MDDKIKEETVKKHKGRQPGTPKTGGRKAGTPNKVSKAVREQLEEIIVGRLDNLAQSLDAIYDSGDYPVFAAMMSKFIPYIAPRLNNVDIRDTTKRDKTLEEQLKEMAEEN